MLKTHAARHPVAPPWQHQLHLRLRAHFVLKALGISLFMWVFFVAYFHTLRRPVYAVQQMPLTALDHAIPFTPSALLAYVSLWLYVSLPPGLMLNLRELLVYGLWAAALCLGGLALFYFVPTAVPPLKAGIDLAAHPGFSLLQGVDAAGNACPSLHVATAVFSAFWIDQQLRHMRAPGLLRALNVAWVLAITWSTLATKQHVFIDAAAGAVLGAVFAAASLRWRGSAGRLQTSSYYS